MRGFPHPLHDALQRGFGFPPGFPFTGGPGPGGGPGFDRGGPHERHHRGRGSSRGRRPNVRTAVLALLAERPMHGYEMIQELQARTGGIWRPSPGSVYPTLQMLEDEGLIEAEATGGRKRFTLTESGRPQADAAAQNPPWHEYTDDNVSQAQDFRDAAVGIMGALKQVGFNGTPEQRTRALKVLKDTRRSLYAILAENDEPDDE